MARKTSGTKGYAGYHGRRRGRGVLAVLLVAVLLLACGFLFAQRYMVYEADGSVRFELPWAKKTAQDVSLNDPIDTDKDGNTLTLLDTIATDDHILEDIDLRMKVRQLYEAVKTRLSPREREIILLRYGLTGQRPLVQREVAKKLNISRSYVSRLEKKALQKLRKAFDE